MGKTKLSLKSRRILRDYPRVCGKDRLKRYAQLLSRESPPRMRERLELRSVCIRSQGITPAYAGKTCVACKERFTIEDHPRVCGKDCYIIVKMIASIGSPPRMRERLYYKRINLLMHGITPAYAGKTPTRNPQASNIQGSPPRMRERPKNSKPFLKITRITPAYAGKTCFELSLFVLTMGSPSRMRERLFMLLHLLK